MQAFILNFLFPVALGVVSYGGLAWSVGHVLRGGDAISYLFYAIGHFIVTCVCWYHAIGYLLR